MDLVFLFASALLIVGFIVSWFLKEVPLRTQSASQQAAADAAGSAPASAATVAAAPTSSAPAVVPAGGVAPDGHPDGVRHAATGTAADHDESGRHEG